LILTACAGTTADPTTVLWSQATTEGAAESVAVVSTALDAELASTPVVVSYDADDLGGSASGAAVSYIQLAGDAIAFDGSGATVDGKTITITAAGTYHISGVLDDGQIRVDTEDEGTVVLVLDGADITCATSAPIYVVNAEKTVLTLADGTENHVADGATYVFADPESDEPNAAILSNDDLTINGSGALTVNANYNNGIASQDDLKITGGEITVYAVNDGIKGKDAIAVKDGTITVDAGGDGLQSSNTEDAEKGYVAVEGGTLTITAGLDGIQAETRIAVSGGSITVSSGGGSVNSSSSGGGMWNDRSTSAGSSAAQSTKGLKAGVDITITGGAVNVDASDDALHSNGSLTIDGGEIVLASGDDGIHADAAIAINGGTVHIIKSYEGIESALITIDDGNIHVVSSDDGINVAGGNDGSSVDGRPGQNTFAASGSYALYIHGGYLAIDAGGDGLDSNGSITMTGGIVLVNGPTNDGNGALDYMGTFNITGGFLVATGSSGMAEAPSTSSTQYAVRYNFASQQAAGTIVHVETQDGQEVLTFAPTKAYQSVVLSSPELKNGETYVLYTGGSSSGTVADSLYAGGTYTAGTQVASFTISSVVTSAGSSARSVRGRPGG
jgi:hypothetical protein